MSRDLEVQARQAADAARVSVVRATAGMIDRKPSPYRLLTGVRTAVIAAVVVFIGGIAFVVGRGPDSTTVSVGPAAQTTQTVPPRPDAPPPAAAPGGVLLTTGTASDGRPWTLALGGPHKEVCFSMALDERVSGGGCAGRVDGLPVSLDERYVPLTFDDSRMRSFIWGRVPPGIRDVEVEGSRGRSYGRQPVVVVGNQDDGFYAHELGRDSSPVAVVGVRPDGTTVRYEVPRRQQPKPIVPTVWNATTAASVVGSVVAAGLLLAALAVWASRRSRRRRDGPSGGSEASR